MTTILQEKLSKTQEAQQGEPVLSPGAGVVQWSVVDGGRVNGGYQTVGEVSSVYGATIIGCDHVGTLHYLAQDGERVKAQQVIAYVKPVERATTRQEPLAAQHMQHPQKAQQRPSGEALAASSQPLAPRIPDTLPAVVPPAHNAPEAAISRAPASPASSPIISENAPQSADKRATGGNGRRSTMGAVDQVPEVEELHIAPATNGKASSNGKAKQKRERTKHHTTHLTPSQIRRVKKLAGRLDLEDIVPGCNEAELVRAALEMLFDLPEPALLAMIEKNREREKAGGYGTGYRRGPGK